MAVAAEVLVIDDNEDIRECLLELLADAGIRAVGFGEGTSALAYLRKAGTPPELILLDVVMPGLSAWGFRAEQLKDARLAWIPVVLISTSRDLAKQARALRAHGFLEKPFDGEQLLALVEEHRVSPQLLLA